MTGRFRLPTAIRSAPWLLGLALVSCRAAPQDPSLRMADLGECKLESGDMIHDCRIGYRTYGSLDPDADNAVVVTTWFTGTTAALSELIGPGRLVDSSRLYVIAVDALGDGVSSSPSNSASQPRKTFPVFTIRDLVETQHRLLEGTLGLHHVKAVVGISMGGMQALQWAVSYPEFMDRVVSIVGTPQQSAPDLLLWRAELNAVRSDLAYQDGAYHGAPILATMADIHALHLRTPDYDVTHTAPSEYPGFAEKAERAQRFDPNDRVRQLEAMLSHDVSAPFGGSLAAAAARVKAHLLIVVNARDLMVNPHPSLSFAPLVNAETLVLDNDCGHLALDCEGARVETVVSEFLARETRSP